MVISKRSLYRIATGFALVAFLAMSSHAAPPDRKGGGDGGGGEGPPAQPFKYAIDLIDGPWADAGRAVWHVAFNANRQIVGGFSYDESGEVQFAYLYDPALGEAVDLNLMTTGVPDGWSIRRATHINSSGVVSGYIQQDGAEALTLAPIIIDPSGTVEVLPDPGGDGLSYSSSVSDLNDVVVSYRRTDGTVGAYVANPNPIAPLGPIDLGLDVSFEFLQINNLLQVIGTSDPTGTGFRTTIDPSYSSTSVEWFDAIVDQTTGEMMSIDNVQDVSTSGAFCGMALVVVPINKRRTEVRSQAFVFDGTSFRTLPQLGNEAESMNDAGDISHDNLIMLAGSDQTLNVIDLLDPDDAISSSVDAVRVDQLGPRVNGYPQIVCRLRFTDGTSSMAILDPIVAQP